MWNKTISGFLFGLLAASLLPAAIVQFNEATTQWMVVFFYTLGFFMWPAIMTYCYAANTAKQAWGRGIAMFSPAAALYLISVLWGWFL